MTDMTDMSPLTSGGSVEKEAEQELLNARVVLAQLRETTPMNPLTIETFTSGKAVQAWILQASLEELFTAAGEEAFYPLRWQLYSPSRVADRPPRNFSPRDGHPVFLEPTVIDKILQAEFCENFDDYRPYYSSDLLLDLLLQIERRLQTVRRELGGKTDGRIVEAEKGEREGV